ncbi:DUF3995 domain-containing protein [Paenibacillus sp. YYML68]|uniref:DUF3995 domain-containing protein n=1 Tax=Paenibacillus sp. YYML68 TaxID=2909250 RepID=UPI00249063EE|nr:DUF3995 domain-containing protein [Paenibacillus sp. YYML68]
MVTTIVIFAAGCLFAISLLHIYWAFGGTWGTKAVIPEEAGQRTFTPGPAVTLLVAAFVAAAGILLLMEADLIARLRGLDFIVRAGAWTCAAVFALRVIGEFNQFGLFKKKRHTTFARMDTLLYVPLCAVLSLAYILAIQF